MRLGRVWLQAQSRVDRFSRGGKAGSGMIAGAEIKLVVSFGQFSVGPQETGVSCDRLLKKSDSLQQVFP